MSIMDKIKEAAMNQFIEVIEWLDESQNTLLYRFPVYQQEIKNGAQLIVRESQAAVFVFEGQVADVFTPGRYTVEGGNTPILSKLGAWKYGFNSPIKAEVYFVNTKQFTDMKWGTSNPIMLRDNDFGIVRLRAFGAYSMRVADPSAFIREVAGTNAHFQTEDIDTQLKRAIVTEFSDALGEMKIPALDLAAQYKELGDAIRQKINVDFSSYGLEVTKFYVENVSLPPEVEAAMDKRASMGALGNVQTYAQFQAADALRDAAQNEGGGAGLGAGVQPHHQHSERIALVDIVDDLFEQLGYDVPATFYWTFLHPLQRANLFEVRSFRFSEQDLAVARQFDAILHGGYVSMLRRLIDSVSSRHGYFIEHGCGCENHLAKLKPCDSSFNYSIPEEARRKTLRAFFWSVMEEYLLFEQRSATRLVYASDSEV
ncbi:SPFH domain-containing protein [Leptolyngbya sp. 7M]|uniref:SPFH domain-containing protein n=1 Tax=Leptolyngbya sp. 7M TaxID=2812896 RepID=UPI001B8CEFA2|nr:SPFH domain-containing protein [Leptolyngbya sp. 7M]QYO67914.1 SPFH domain-containing protein [Leptolyngbya sp. 7M]